jgi:hypothetical protein
MIPRYGEWSKRVAVVGVHTPETEGERDVARLRRFAADNRIAWPIVLDPEYAAWKAFGVEAWPTIVLIDRAGVVRASFVGDDSAPAIERALADLL